MSATVDNRIVQMQFDNAQFEKGVAQSTQSLNNLKESLNLENSVKGVEEVSQKFSAMEIAVTTAIATIVNKITNMGLSLAKSLSIDQITSGFSKYEEELKAVQVIMNATGENIDDVTERLRKLSWYTDETSYSYSDMVNNISKFTSQGIKLADAERQMEGIANMAGLAGASVGDATHAMDGFSKAMAAGSMKLQNWKWIQTAHMETMQTKEAFLEAAVAVGTLTKAGDHYVTSSKGTIVTAKNFTETLHEGWLNAEAMQKALYDMGSYSDTIHNFQQAWEDAGRGSLSCSEAMEKLDNVSEMTTEELLIYGKAQGIVDDAVSKTTVSSEKLVEIQEDISKWTDSAAKKGFEAAQQYRTFADAIEATKDAASSQFKEIFSNLFGNAEEAKNLWGAIGDTLNELFVGPLYEYSDIFREFHDEFNGFEIVLENVEALIGGITSVIQPFRDAIERLFPKPTAKQIANFCTQLTGFMNSLKLSEDAVKGLTNVLELLGLPIKAVANVLGFVLKLAGALIIIINGLIGRFLEMFSSTKKLESSLRKLFGEENYSQICTALSNAVSNLSKVFKQFGEIIVKVISGIASSPITAKVIDGFAKAVTGLANALSKGLIWALDKLSKIDLSKISGTLDDLFSGKISLIEVGGNIVAGLAKGMMSGISEAVKAAGKIANTIVETIKNALGIASPSKVAISIGGFLVAGLVIGLTKSEGALTSGLNSILDPFKNFFSALDLGKVIVAGFAAAFAASVTIITVQVGRLVGSFANVLNGFASIEKSISSVFTGIGKYISDLGKAEKWKAMSSTIREMAICIGILSAALIALTLIPKDGIKEAGTAIAQLLTVFATFAFIMTMISNMKNPKAQIKPVESLASSLESLMTKLGKSALIVSFGIACNMIGSAFLKLAIAIKIIENCENGVGIAIGTLAAIAVMVSAMSLLARNVKKHGISKNAAAMGAAMVAMAVAINLLLIPIKLLAGAEWEDIDAGVYFIGGAIILLGAFANFAARAKGMSKNLTALGSSMIAMAVAINLLLIPIKLLANTEFKDISTGIIFVGGALVLMGVIANFAARAKRMSKNLSALGACMLEMAIAIDLLLIPIMLLKNVEYKDIETGIYVVGGALVLMGIFANFAARAKGMSKNLKVLSSCLISMALAVDLLIAPLILLKNVEFKDIETGVYVVGGALVLMGIFANFAARAKGMSKNLAALGVAMLAMTAAVVGISGVIALLSLIPDTAGVLISALSVGIVIVALSKSLSAITQASGKGNDLIKAAACLAGLTICLNALIPIFLTLGKMTFASVATTVGALVITLAAISGALLVLAKIANDTKGMTAKQYMTVAESIAILSGVMLVIGASIALVGQLDLSKIAASTVALITSFIAVAGSLIGIGVVISKTKSLNAKDLLMVSSSIAIVSGAMLVIAGSLSLVAKYDFASLASGVFALIGTLTAMSVALGLLSQLNPAALIAVGAALVLVSTSLLIAAVGLQAFANVNAEGLKNVIAAFADCAKYALGITAMGAAMVVFGAGLAVVGVGVIAVASGLLIATPAILGFTTALLALSTISEQGVANISAVLDLLIEKIPAFAAAVGAGIVNIITALANAGPQLIALIQTIITGIITTVSENAVSIAETIITILDMILSKCTEWAPKLIDFIGSLVVQICAKIVELVPVLVATGISIIQALIIGIGQGALTLVNTAAETLLAFLNGLAQSIVTYAPQFKEAGQNIIAAIVTAITGSEALGDMTKAGLQAIDGFVAGLGDGLVNVVAKAKEIGGTLLDTVKNVLAIKSPSRYMRDIGLYVDEGLNQGLDKGKGNVLTTAKEVGQTVITGVKGVVTSGEAKKIGAETDENLVSGIMSNLGIAGDAGSSLKNSVLDGLMGLVEGSGIIGKDSVEQLKKYLTGTVAVTQVYDAASGTFRESIKFTSDAVNDLGVDVDGLANSMTGGSGATKSASKSIQELAKEYHYGDDAVKQFAKTYGETMLKCLNGTQDMTVQSVKSFRDGFKSIREGIDETDDYAESTLKSATDNLKNNINDALTSNNQVMELSTKAIDNLAFHLYTLSDQYKEDLNNAELNTETMLQHIQTAFNETFSQIQSDLNSVDWFSEVKEDENPIDIETMNSNYEDQIARTQEYISLKSKIAASNLSDDLKKMVYNLPMSEMSMIRAIADADEDQLSRLEANISESNTLIETGAATIASSAAAGLIDLTNTMDTGANAAAVQFLAGLKNPIQAAIDNGDVDQRVGTLAQNAIKSLRDAWQIHSPSQVAIDNTLLFLRGITETLDNQATYIYNKGKSLASRLCEGLKMGIREGKSGVVSAIVDMVRASIAAAEEELDEHSPSRVFEKIGQFIDLGMAKGIEEYGDKVDSASHYMAASTINSVNHSISQINDMVGGKILVNPVITPELDLSLVQANAKNLNGLFENSRLAASAIQNGSNNGSNNSQINLKVTSPVYLNGREIAIAVNEELGVML